MFHENCFFGENVYWAEGGWGLERFCFAGLLVCFGARYRI